MRMINIKLVSKVLIGAFIIIFLNVKIFSIICHNGSGGGYDDGKALGDGGSAAIESYIVKGGGYYLDANAAIQELLCMVELQGVNGTDIAAFENTVDRTILSMKNASANYSALIRAAAATPYKYAVIEKLAAFDYGYFMRKYRLNAVIVEEVESYLKKGDITGVFQETYTDFSEILYLLNTVKSAVSMGKLPEIMVFRRLNEKTAEVSLFGSCVARVFSDL